MSVTTAGLDEWLGHHCSWNPTRHKPQRARRGNCYVASEALYHILGGTRGDWVPHRLKTRTDTHWYLVHRGTGVILDPSRRQFGRRLPDYTRGRGAGFLTSKPSRRARALMEVLTWQS